VCVCVCVCVCVRGREGVCVIGCVCCCCLHSAINTHGNGLCGDAAALLQLDSWEQAPPSAPTLPFTAYAPTAAATFRALLSPLLRLPHTHASTHALLVSRRQEPPTPKPAHPRSRTWCWALVERCEATIAYCLIVHWPLSDWTTDHWHCRRRGLPGPGPARHAHGPDPGHAEMQSHHYSFLGHTPLLERCKAISTYCNLIHHCLIVPLTMALPQTRASGAWASSPRSRTWRWTRCATTPPSTASSAACPSCRASPRCASWRCVLTYLT